MAGIDEREFLFGKIAVTLGFTTEERIEECLEIQRRTSPDLPIGRILIDEGHMDRDHIEEVLATQRNYLRKIESHSREKVEDTIFGRLVVNNMFATENQVDDAVREQRKRETQGVIVPLGSILVEWGLLTMEQVESILKRQWKKILVCKPCQKQFNVFGFEPGKQFLCRKCQTPLEVPRALRSVHVEKG